jgi:malate permease and related proteins
MLLTILQDIAPVFLVIALGFFVRRWGFLPDAFSEAANRLVYYIGIPCLIFGQVAVGDFSQNFRPEQIAATLAAVLAVTVAAIVLALLLRLPVRSGVTFTQNCVHGNTGYIALAVVLYVLGEKGLAGASVLAGFIMLINNTVSLALFNFSPHHRRALSWKTLRGFVGNPIVVAALLGLGFSALRIPLPQVAVRSIGIVSDMALPVALLIIGGSLRPGIRARLPVAHLTSLLKLVALPAAGVFFFRLFGVAPADAVPAIILLGSPAATISYVMAKEMDGDPELAAAAVTVSTVLSIVTYTLWIALLKQGA